MQHAYTQFTENKFAFSFSHTVAEYILGDAPLLPKPWVDAEHILFPVHISSQEHWILLRLNLKNFSLYVYNSLKDTHGYAAEVVKAYSVMLAIFFKEMGIGCGNDTPLRVEVVSDLPVQQTP